MNRFAVFLSNHSARRTKNPPHLILLPSTNGHQLLSATYPKIWMFRPILHVEDRFEDRNRPSTPQLTTSRPTSSQPAMSPQFSALKNIHRPSTPRSTTSQPSRCWKIPPPSTTLRASSSEWSSRSILPRTTKFRPPRDRWRSKIYSDRKITHIYDLRSSTPNIETSRVLNPNIRQGGRVRVAHGGEEGRGGWGQIGTPAVFFVLEKTGPLSLHRFDNNSFILSLLFENVNIFSTSDHRLTVICLSFYC